MVERRVCTFCGNEIEPGTGRMYIKKDGVTYQFCTSKCYKNMVELKRVPRRTTWTSWYAREKQVRLKGAEPEPEPKKARKVRTRAKSKEPTPVKAEETDVKEVAPAGSGAADGPEADKGDE
jgi:large subunit ribosomal protein L24e